MRLRSSLALGALLAALLSPTTSTAAPPDSPERDAAYDAYQQQLKPALAVPIGWTGSAASCTPGAPSAAAHSATLTALNYLRGLAKLSPVTFSPTASANAQRAALIMEANSNLSHFPPSTWRCWTSTGQSAAGASNLALGRSGAAAMVEFTFDSGAGNEFTGHRRMLLYPPQRVMGNGATSRADALLVHGTTLDPTDTGPEWMPWPIAGYFPVQLEPFGRWSLSAAGADFSSASVSVRRGGVSVPLRRYTPVNGYGTNTLTWQVDLNVGPGRADDPYDVTVTGIRRGGQTVSHSYTVTLFDATVDARQTVTLRPLTPMQYGDSVTPSASSSSGLPVRITTTTPAVCTATAGVVRAVGLGTCTVSADQPGDAIRRAAAPVTTDVVVSPRPVVVRPVDQSRVIGTPNPELRVSYVGIAPGETTGDIAGTPVCTTTAALDSPLGAYPITCDISGLTSTHYTLTTAPGTLTVAEEPPTVTVTPDVISAGQRVTATYTGKPNTVLDILSKTQPATSYTRIGSVTLDANGTGTSSHAPNRNTRLAARTPLGTMSSFPLIQVRSVASINVYRAQPRLYLFTGTVSPPLTNRLVSLYRNGVLTAQARTDARGVYAIAKPVTAGTFDFAVRTPNDAYNLGAISRTLRVRVT
jgi:uncharacterized protein YkwD